uniref:Uncharacterized protein n=1 Tax=Arundo donax TaxID=35708 RepID=A0A0A9B9R1_ARUDO
MDELAVLSCCCCSSS